MAITRISFHNN